MDCADYKLPWHALQVRPNHEDLVSTLLTYKGYETYLPKYRTASRHGGQNRRAERRLFPGYVFCRFSPARSGQVSSGSGVVTTTGVLRIVGAGDVAIPVPDTEIEAIYRILESNLVSEPWTYLRVGQKVHINAGPLRGITGLLTSFDRLDRLVVSINVLQRSLAVSIEPDWVSPMPALSQALAAVRHTAVTSS
jgi:transcription antitermination factor NusG